MTYSTLMAHLELGHSSDGLLSVAGDLAERFHATPRPQKRLKASCISYSVRTPISILLERAPAFVARCLRPGCMIRRFFTRARSTTRARVCKPCAS